MKERRSLVAPPSFYAQAAKIALPICLQQLLNQGAGFVDTLMVSYIGYVSAVTVAAELNNLMFLLGFGINSGISIYAAQFYGIRDWKNLRRVFGLFMGLNLAAAVLFFTLTQWGGTDLLRFYSKDALLVEKAWEYLSIASIAFFFTSLTNAFGFMYRCIQKTTVPMAIGIGVNLTNAALNYVLIFGKLGFPALGVRGAAIATVIATGLGLGAHIVFAFATRQPFLGKLRDLLDWPGHFIAPMLRRMAPIMCNELLFGLGDTMYIKAFALLGSEALESYKVANSVGMIPYVVTFGMGNACALIIGERLGRKDISGARDTVRYLLPISGVCAVAITGLMLLCARPAVGIFQLSSPAVTESAVLMTMLFSLRIATRLFNVVFMFSMRAGGDTGYLMFLDCGLVWLLGIPLAYVSVLVLGVTSMPLLFLIVQTEQVVRMLVAMRRVRSGKWLRNLTDEVEKKPA